MINGMVTHLHSFMNFAGSFVYWMVFPIHGSKDGTVGAPPFVVDERERVYDIPMPTIKHIASRYIIVLTGRARSMTIVF